MMPALVIRNIALTAAAALLAGACAQDSKDF